MQALAMERGQQRGAGMKAARRICNALSSGCSHHRCRLALWTEHLQSHHVSGPAEQYSESGWIHVTPGISSLLSVSSYCGIEDVGCISQSSEILLEQVQVHVAVEACDQHKYVLCPLRCLSPIVCLLCLRPK